MADTIVSVYRALTEEREAQTLLESRIDWLKDNFKDISFEHDPHGPAKTSGDLIDKIAAEGDPTHNKVHTQWLTNLYRNKAFKQEDLYKAHAALTDYEGVPATKNAAGERVEGRKGIKHMMTPEERNISHAKYPSIFALQGAMAKHVSGGLPASNISNALSKWEASGKGGHDQVYDDEHVRMYRIAPTPEGKEASKAIYGPSAKAGHTDWCTANHDDEHNYFDHYMKENPGSNLYVVHRKSDGEVFQYHTHSNQFMNKNDDSISNEDFKSIMPSVHKAWSQDPSLTD